MTPAQGAETPVPRDPSAKGGTWGSDVIADMLRALGVDYISLNPGSSFRGLHDSLVNHLGNERPQMLLCLHEEHAVAIAHGWAKVTGRAMAVVLHANVGLMHASMAIYNAWCDRVPMLILGATGPVDASVRRPWIDWIHTSRDQAAMVRPFLKWDDQPASLDSSLTAMVEAKRVAETWPPGPTYVCFDVSVQEQPVGAAPEWPEPSRYAMPALPTPSAAELDAVLEAMAQAQKPVILMGRVSREASDWRLRVALAEHWGAQVLTDIKTGASFPTDHRLHVGPPSFFLSPPQEAALREADCVLCLDWVDAGSSLAKFNTQARVLHVSMDHVLKNGWSYDHGRPMRADVHLATTPDVLLHALAQRLGLTLPSASAPERRAYSPVALRGDDAPIGMDQLAAALAQGLGEVDFTLVRLPLGWDAAHWHFTQPLDYLGYDGGAGIGSGPGMLVGAALALQDSGRVPVAVLGDGDTMMGISALWTAAHYAIPVLLVVCNNRSYFNDEVHQEKVALARGRPVANKAIGQAMTHPDIDFAQLARAQGVEAIGPVTTPAALAQAVAQGVQRVQQGACVLIDARVQASYAASMSQGMTEAQG